MDDKLKQVLHKVELLCEQNPEFAALLRERLGFEEPVNAPSETTAFIKLQRKNMRNKGRVFYGAVKNDKLRNQLVNDYAMAMWYKCIGDIPHMFAYILFQVENMLNAFIISHGEAAYNDVKNNPDVYVYSYAKEGQKPFTSAAKDYFFDTTGKNKSIENIGMWAKYTYWYVATQQPISFQSLTHSLVSDIINFRNYTEHRNSQKDMPEWMEKHIKSWTIDIEAKYGYIDILLSAILASVKTIES